MTTNSRPDRSTMEGMIWNANHVLDEALKTPTNKLGAPVQLFEKCYGIVLISVVEAGFMVTGSVGTGIIMRKIIDPKDGKMTWSLPSACGIAGIGWGFLAGASLKDIIVFIMDELTFDALSSDKGLKLGLQAEITVGSVGRSWKLDFNVSQQGVGSTLAIAFSKGLFGGISTEGSVLGVRNECNLQFYGKYVSASDILKGGNVVYPEGKITYLNEVYEKLKTLSGAKDGATEPQFKIY